MKKEENSGPTETTGQLPNLQKSDPLTGFYAYCDSKEEAIFARLMGEYAQKRGERFIQENERLKADPSAAVPEDVHRRMLETIYGAFDKKQSG